MKATFIAPANIAFVKYWGRKDSELWLPYNESIAMTLDNCTTTTTVEVRKDFEKDEMEIGCTCRDVASAFVSPGGTSADKLQRPYEKISRSNGDKNKLLFEQIERIRKLGGKGGHIKVRSQNTFPSAVGIAASASGFAALTAALLKAMDKEEILQDSKEFSRFVRLGGSASAIRSIHGGFTETVLQGKECFARQLAEEKHWDLVDIVAVVCTEEKTVSSLQGHAAAETSAYFQTRLQELPERLRKCRRAIQEKNFPLLGECIEADTISMHTIAMTSRPPIYYWTGGTVNVLRNILKWRNEGLESYFSVDAGPNVHVICEEQNVQAVEKKLKEMPEVQYTIVNRPTKGVRFSEEHLF